MSYRKIESTFLVSCQNLLLWKILKKISIVIILHNSQNHMQLAKKFEIFENFRFTVLVKYTVVK